MFGISDFSIEVLTAHPWLVALALVGLVALTALLYRRTNPPLPLWRRILMAALRVAAVIVLIAALFEPVISYSRHFERPRQVAVVLDRSASMKRVENDKSRLARMDSLLSSKAYDAFREDVNVNTYYFGENLATSAGDVKADKTSLGDCLRDLEKDELADPSDYWLVLSDGNSNSGLKPVEAVKGMTTPITTIGMALDVGEFDVGLAEINANPVMFVGTPSDISVKLSWHGGSGKTVPVQLRDNNRVLTETSFKIAEEGGFADLKLKYVPDSPGKKLLQVSIPKLEGETSVGNNNRTIAVKVLKSRLEILLLTSEPDYEVGFLSRHFRQSDRYDVDLRSLGSKSGNLAGKFPTSQADLNRFDLVILHDPDPGQLTGAAPLLKSYLADRGGAVWLMIGNRLASKGVPDWMRDLLPFYPSGQTKARYREFHVVPAEGQLFHPTIRLADDRAAIRKRWASLPPFDMLVPCDHTSENATILAFAPGSSDKDRLPVIGYKRTGGGKLLMSAVQPFWYWAFESLGYTGDNSGYATLIDGTISWLTVSDDFEPIRIKPEKDVFTRGESVRFDGFAFDQGFRPIPEVTGTVELKPADGGDPYEADLIARGEGAFVAQFDEVPPGRYRYRGEFVKDGQQLKQETGDVLIETFSLEEFDQQGNPATLRSVSQASGGQYFRFDDFDKALNSLAVTPVTESVRSEFSLWGRLWLLLLFIGLLTVEWLLRKAHHLL